LDLINLTKVPCFKTEQTIAREKKSLAYGLGAYLMANQRPDAKFTNSQFRAFLPVYIGGRKPFGNNQITMSKGINSTSLLPVIILNIFCSGFYYLTLQKL
jgi:hypothetical protein